ncbi:MAG: hypothetical protein VYE22_36950 [Myxococcota bacterium]|nr:hypothetical protein [Myxococcota bacterium]
MNRETRALIFGWVLSVGLHASLIGYVYWATTAPELGFEFTLPMEVELGMTDAVSVTEGASGAAAEAEAAAAEGDEGEGVGADGGVPDAGAPDAGPPDAGRRRRRDAGPPQVAEADDEGEGAGDEGEGAGDTDGEGRGVAFLPAGSQIALRMDVGRIRRSPLAGDVRALIAAIPDWTAMLDGSGIDPLDDLDRVLIATPNLQRSRLIIAGRATADADAIRAAATRLASAAGTPIAWEQRHGVEVAPWRSRDDTERVIAIIGPRHFIISRPQDLPRVLAVARNRSAETEEEEHFADALLSMEEGEGLSLEVEGARNFARNSPRRQGPIEMVPLALRLALSEEADQRVAARSRWRYEGETQAEEAAGYWDRMREGYGRNPVVAFMGIGGILQRATIEPEGDHFEGNVDMQMTELGRLLGLARGIFQDRARARQGTSAPPAPAPPSPGPSGPRPPPSPFE